MTYLKVTAALILAAGLALPLAACTPTSCLTGQPRCNVAQP